jgi:hypothetical protein
MGAESESVQLRCHAGQLRSMADNSNPKPFDYAAFVEELQTIVSIAKGFNEPDRHHDSRLFRQWRHEVEDLIVRVNRLRYDVNTQFRGRSFRAMNSSATFKMDQQAFDRDLSDTLGELELVIARFQKYGDPKQDKIRPGPGLLVVPELRTGLKADSEIPLAPQSNPEPTSKPEPLEWPAKEKATLYWFLKHMPITAWIGLLTVLGAAYTAGLTSGNWDSVKVIFTNLAKPTPTNKPGP